MSVVWDPPSRINPILSLPIPDVEISIPASVEMIQLWTGGPINSSKTAVSDALALLISGIGILIRNSRAHINVSQKSDASDYVTNIDIGVERLLREWLRRFRPHDKIIGEECGHDIFSFSDVVWFIDPIDGTSNFIDGDPNVSVHLGSFLNGEPFVSIVGLPFLNTVLHTNATFSATETRSHKSTLRLGTEMRIEESPENITLRHITQKLGASVVQVKSIGVNILGLINGQIDAFYKPKAKYWDLIAPLGLIAAQYPGRFRMTMTYCDDNKQIQTVPLFGFSDHLIPYLNQRHQIDYRIGLVIVVPSDRTDLETIIIKEVNQCMSLSF